MNRYGTGGHASNRQQPYNSPPIQSSRDRQRYKNLVAKGHQGQEKHFSLPKIATVSQKELGKDKFDQARRSQIVANSGSGHVDLNNEALKMYSNGGAVEKMLNKNNTMGASRSNLGRKGMTIQYSVNNLDVASNRGMPNLNDALASMNMPATTKVHSAK